MREMFEGYLKQSEPLFERLDTVQSQLGYTETLIRRFIASDSPRYFFQRMPCLSGLLTPEMTAMEQLLFLNRELFHMIEDSISLDLLARLYSTQLTTNGEKHLLDHNRIYYKLLRKIIAKGQSEGQLSSRSNVNEMVKLYALCERALLYDWCLCAGEYALTEYSAKVLPGFLSSFLP